MRVLDHAVERSNLRNGGVISFHHHLRNGDRVMADTLAACQRLGLRDLHLAPSSLFPCHAALIPFLRDGTVTQITTAYINGPLADFVSNSEFCAPVRLTTHGGRARMIEAGALPIDLAVIAAPACDRDGNLGGGDGPAACGPLGYAMPDAAHSAHVLALVQTRVPQLSRVCISGQQVQDRVDVDSIGEAAQIESGTTARPVSEVGASIADLTVQALRALGVVRDGMTFQAGAGGVSLEVTRRLARDMAQGHIVGDFAAGGITQTLVQMHQQGVFRRLMDVQAFDLAAVQSYARDSDHHGMSASAYANPRVADCIAHQLDVMILGAAEVDVGFNVNVTTTGDGRIIGGSGGHGDTAEGAKLSVVVVPTQTKGQPRIVQRVRCVSTPGASIDLVVTEQGICVNPARSELEADLRRAKLPVVDISALAGHVPGPEPSEKLVAISEDRHGAVLDHVYASGALNA